MQNIWMGAHLQYIGCMFKTRTDRKGVRISSERIHISVVKRSADDNDNEAVIVQRLCQILFP